MTRLSFTDRSLIGALLVDECAAHAIAVRPGVVSACRADSGSEDGPVGRGSLGWFDGIGRIGRDEVDALLEAVGCTIEAGRKPLWKFWPRKLKAALAAGLRRPA